MWSPASPDYDTDGIKQPFYLFPFHFQKFHFYTVGIKKLTYNSVFLLYYQRITAHDNKVICDRIWEKGYFRWFSQFCVFGIIWKRIQRSVTWCNWWRHKTLYCKVMCEYIRFCVNLDIREIQRQRQTSGRHDNSVYFWWRHLTCRPRRTVGLIKRKFHCF